jgi:hypothetical protein
MSLFETDCVFKIILLFVVFIICVIILPQKYEPFANEFFEQVKIKLKPNPLNVNLNNNIINGGGCGTNNYPDVVVPVYAPWRTYWPASAVYPYYPFYPYYYNNYYWPN